MESRTVSGELNRSYSVSRWCSYSYQSLGRGGSRTARTRCRSIGCRRHGVKTPERTSVNSREHIAIAVAFSSDGKTVASGSWDKTVQLWSLDGRPLQTFQGHSASVSGISFSPDGRTLAPGLAKVASNPQAVLTEILAWTNGQPF